MSHMRKRQSHLLLACAFSWRTNLAVRAQSRGIMKHNRPILTLLILSLALSFSFFTIACDDLVGSDPDIEAVITIEDPAPPIGVQVMLDGRQSVYEGTDPVFSWSMEVPQGSSAAIAEPAAQVTSFVPDVEGDYIVTLSVSAEGVEDSRTITIAAGGGDVVISSNISNDMTFYSANRYIVTNSISLSNARLIIEPGTEIRFDQGTRLVIGSDGILVADGTEEEPILFTGTNESRGWWRGVVFQGTTHPHNLLDHVIIEYGGGEAFHSSTQPANLTISRSISSNAASLTLTNSILRHSAGFGLFVHANGSLPDSGDNVFTSNAMGPAAVDASSLHYLDSGSDYSGNDSGNDAVQVVGNSISDNFSWQALNVPYFVRGDISISDSEFSIAPGATFLFDAEREFLIGSGTIISMSGTEDEPITFSATQQTPGWWDGIVIIGTTHPNNIMEHVVIEYAGRSAYHGSTEPANLTVSRSISSNAASVELKHSTMRHSAGYGLFLHSNGSMRGSENNIYTNNEEGPARAYTSGAHYFDSGSSYSGNGSNDYVYINANTQSQSVTWQALDVPYGMTGESTIDNGNFIIEPGAEFSFDVNAGLILRGDVSLSVVGTAAEPIIFTAMNQSPGWWKGVYIFGTQQPNNNMEHVIIEYAGSSAWHGSVEPANLVVGRSISSNNARLELRNSTLRFSDAQGLHVHSGSEINADVCDVNVFENNATDGCVVME